VRIASARAGNVIGGGDWAQDRIVPDCIRALQQDQAVQVRNPKSTRPWQHVLEPLSGYLWLAAWLADRSLANAEQELLASAFNFGPSHEANRTVGEIVAEILKHWPGRWEDKSDSAAVHEARLLQLANDKAHALLGWSPVWNFQTTIEQTVKWYSQARTTKDTTAIQKLTATQIEAYSSTARAAGVAWASK